VNPKFHPQPFKYFIHKLHNNENNRPSDHLLSIFFALSIIYWNFSSLAHHHFVNVHTNFGSLTNFHHHLECAQQLCKLYVCAQIHITKGNIWSFPFAFHSLQLLIFAIFTCFYLQCILFSLRFLLVFDCSLETHPSRISINFFHNGGFKSLNLS
jgi:hypothetical protein